MVAHRQPALLDRAVERQALDALLESVRGGHSAVLVIRGEAGVGKTALLHYCARQASGFRVARIAGVESEMELPFAALHQLCAPLLGHVDALPAPQQTALRVALGLSLGAAPDRFLVALATLSLLAEVAAERPLLCIVDDSQWLDAASAQVLGFVARRLLAESVAAIFVVRDQPDQREFAGLPELALGGLADLDARALLATAMPGWLDEDVRDRLIAETRGNPLALLELAREPAATQVPGGVVPAQELSGRIEQSFLRRLEGLPDEARLLLLIAAAEPVGDPLLLWRAAERLGVSPGAASSAAEELLAIGERVTFRHPLVRSAVYRSATSHDRRAVHLALADVTESEVDFDRRAWHLAGAAAGPDERVAAELEVSATRAQARGGVTAAAAYLRRAVALTRDPARRAERALAASQASLRAGAFEAALALLAVAESGTLDELQCARVDLLRGQIAFASGLGSDAPPLLLNAAKRLEPLDMGLARETYVNACGAALFAGPAGAGALAEIAQAAKALPAAHGGRAVDMLLDGVALLITEGHAAAAPTLLRAGSAFAGEGATLEEGLRWGWMATTVGNTLWDDDGVRAICTRQIQVARTLGALDQLPIYLIALGSSAAKSGEFADAAALIAEADAVTKATGSRIAPIVELLLAALRGRQAETVALIATLEHAADRGQGIAATVAHWAAAILHNGLGQYEDALAAARLASSAAGDLSASIWALAELIEAAARCNEPELAKLALKRLIETTQPAGTDFGLGIEARSRALLSEEQAAEGFYQVAIERLSRTRLRPELARAHLLYGEWLRREGRRVNARDQLRTAHEMFHAIGMEAFAERAHRELLATGETVRKRNLETRDELTAQEWQIVRMANDGLSNREIGAQLFLSPRTVEWHLGKVFTKLGVASRMGLRDALPPEGAPA